jgi:hemolysin III
MTRNQSEYSIAEEVFHAISHGAGAILSIAGLSWMLYVSIEAADPWRISASIVYGTSLIALFLASTVYHAMHTSRHRQLFKLLDHCAIYLLIAGTYTPFLLVAMRTTTGWWLFGAIWTLATAGILTKLWFRNRFPRLALAGYLVMGWLVVIALPQVVDAVGPNGMVWLVYSGLPRRAANRGEISLGRCVRASYCCRSSCGLRPRQLWRMPPIPIRCFSVTRHSTSRCRRH